MCVAAPVPQNFFVTEKNVHEFGFLAVCGMDVTISNMICQELHGVKSMRCYSSG